MALLALLHRARDSELAVHSRQLGHSSLSCLPEKLPKKLLVAESVPPMKDKGKEMLDAWTTVQLASQTAIFLNAISVLQLLHGMGYVALFCKDSWEEVPVFGAMHCLFKKLHHLKAKLSAWNKDQFGNIFEMVKEAEEEASKAEILFEENPSSENKTLYNQKMAQLVEMTNREYAFWKQKCNLKWLQDGDVNIKFFHNLVKNRRRQQQINLLIYDQGKIIDKPDELEALAVQHYTNLLNQAEPSGSPELYGQFLDTIPSLIDQGHNDFLMSLPTEEEIKQIIWQMDPNSAAGPDGFNITFFRSCWDFIKSDVVSACQEVFLCLHLPQAAASSNICLLPKVDNARKLNDFRPICLSTVASKIATKCIASRLSTLLPLIISEEQAAYVPRREILDQILITKEMVQHINRKVNGGNLIVKLDMAKAFDKLKWSYLFYILRGVKQGDPLSPLLFIIANEGFSRNLNRLVENGLIGRSVLNLKKFLHDYQMVSGQTINYGKSSFMTGTKLNSLATYLGVPNDLGITRKIHCSKLIPSFDNKLNGWLQKNLDQAGRLVLIKHVLNTLPNYFLGVNTIPKAISHLLEQKMARFWWGGGNRHHWISWEKFCFPKEEGGLGIRDLKSLEDSFSLKLWWKFHQDNGLWARLMRSKYWREGDIWEALTDSPVWKRISRIDEIASNACAVNEDGSMVWSLEANGSFSLKSAFDFCRPSSPIVASFKYLWMKPQIPKVGVFTWKLFKHCLPIPENLQRLGFHLPSICPFCRADSFASKHVFLDCPQIEEVWKHFSACLGFLHRFSSSINQHFMDWWLRGNCNNIYGFLRMHLPGIICWHIWKELNAIIHEGKTDFSSRTLIDSISMFVRQWLAAKIPKKLKGADAWLNEKKLLPFFPKAHKIRVVKWLAPPKGRLKLNIDASFTSGSKRGAAILRDDEGRFGHNDFLMSLPTEEEIKQIIWQMDPNSAAGPDGFNITFFRSCWDFIKSDVVSACQEVFLCLPLPQAAASSNICLLPKVDNARKLNDFRPICLSTVASKIATKCIASRLSTLLPLIISEEQAAYVPRREILDQILITKEMVQHINRKVNGGNLIVKLDMAKAFDKLKWSYLFDILRKIHCSKLIQSFDNKLNGWLQKNLDQAGRLVLIKHVLNTLPNYFLGVNTIPKAISHLLEQKMARFWWGGGNRHHWISWEKLCFPKEEGGLGIRDLKSLEDSFGLKLWWKFHQDNGLWARLMRSKYWREGDIWEALTDSPVWKRISRIDEIASNACAVNEDGSMVWSLEANGSFSLKSAFDFCRPSFPIVASFKYLWMKPQNPKEANSSPTDASLDNLQPSYLYDEDDVQIPARGGFAPAATPQSTAELPKSIVEAQPTVNVQHELPKSTAAAQSAVQPELPQPSLPKSTVELPATADVQPVLPSAESAPVLGRSQRQRTPNVRLSDYQTYAVTHGVAPEIPNCKYPLTHYIGYAKFSAGHRAYLAAVDSGHEPQLYKEAVKSPHWRQAMTAEIDAL
ncbi:unnamed protein product [Cuscuta campestris]|uniref:Reverse transcriptase domain-containing protein n=1 Tax=Cuscuta campestris TaxID=132261 RepID=A0A484LAM3_9ASTE|nr:unnamed protein product [Cuscuta campestris]